MYAGTPSAVEANVKMLGNSVFHNGLLGPNQL